jgi:hypothetical protein
MDHGAILLQALLGKLRPWFPFIQRSTHAETVEVRPLDGGAFVLCVSGVAKDGSAWTSNVAFDREKCFGVTYTLPPSSWQVVVRPCDHARDVVRSVLKSRGFL